MNIIASISEPHVQAIVGVIAFLIVLRAMRTNSGAYTSLCVFAIAAPLAIHGLAIAAAALVVTGFVALVAICTRSRSEQPAHS